MELVHQSHIPITASVREVSLPPEDHPIATSLGRIEPNADNVSDMVNLLLADATTNGVSDIHFDPTPASLEIRYRRDGVLLKVADISKELAPNVTARLKVLSNLLTYRMDVPQEGRVEDAKAKFGQEMRVSTFPTIHGEKAVVRNFSTTTGPTKLSELGLEESQLSSLHKILLQRTGCVLMTGPSGSGKSTTTYAALRFILEATEGQRHIVTLEDPVEQVLAGVSQSQVRSGTEFDFARGLRSILRQDPEVIMIGEIRDPETATTAIEASLTGHLVISTVHSGTACGVIGRLLEMRIEPHLITSGLNAVINQRLVRRLCTSCVGPGQSTGCRACGATGYTGRLLLAELLELSKPIRELILRRVDTETLAASVETEGVGSLWSSADRAIASGLTTSSEVERVLGPR